jgi:hypothetical protein
MATEQQRRKKREPAEGGTRPRSGQRRAPQLPRMSVTLPMRLRKLIRIAAARADLEIGDWCKVVLTEAADRTYRKYYPEDE